MSWENEPKNRIVFDIGAHKIRAGLSTNEDPIYKIENLAALDKRSGTLVYGKPLEAMLDESYYKYMKPLTRGVIVNYENEILLIEDALPKILESSETKNYNNFSLTATLQMFSPEKVKERFFEVVFEYFDFGAFLPLNPQVAIQNYLKSIKKLSSPFQLIVESTHSATYVAPFFDDEIMNYACKRLEVGGKLLTNYLKEIVSFRFLNMKNEYRTINQMKEEMCFLSENFPTDMKAPKGKFQKYFVLPDFEIGKKGYATEFNEQSDYNQKIALDKERFSVPEIIFHPKDIGLNQAGIIDTIHQSINEISPEISNYFYENIYLSGGNARFPNLFDRFSKEIIETSPQIVDTLAQDFSFEEEIVYKGCSSLSRSENFRDMIITRQEFKENGFSHLSKFYLI